MTIQKSNIMVITMTDDTESGTVSTATNEAKSGTWSVQSQN